MPDRTADQPLTEYLEILARRKWWVVAVTVLFVGAALGVSTLQVKKYTATAQVLAQTTALPSAAYQVQPTQPLATDQLATYVQLATSPSVINLVRTKLGVTGKVPPVAVSLVGSSNLIGIAATSTQPAEAALIANDYADAFASYETGIAKLQAQSLVTSYTFDYNKLSAQLRQAQTQHDSSGEIAIAAQEALIAQDLAVAESAVISPSSAITVVSAASVPGSPSSPKPVRNGLLGLLIGLLLGLALAIGLDYRDDRIKSESDVQQISHNLPVLAAVPMIDSWKRRKDPLLVSLVDPTSSDVESYWSFQTSLKFVAQVRTIRSVVITSPGEGEGKTTTIANLGVVFARSGQRTVVVSCDLRRPRLGSFFKETPSTGLMSVLRREVSLEAAVKAVSGVKDLWLLDAGPLPSDPHRMLSDPATARVLKELALNFDMVLIDSPPLLAVADAIQLGQIADATVLVTSLGQTKKRQLQRALEMLETSHVPVIGLLLNAVTRQSTYGYGYSGYTGYSSKAPALTTATPEGELSTGVPLAFLSGDGDTHGSGAHSPNRVATPDVGEARPAWRALADQADSPG